MTEKYLSVIIVVSPQQKGGKKMKTKDAMKKKLKHRVRGFCKRILKLLTDKNGCIRNVPRKDMDSIAEMLLTDISAFYETEEGKRVFAEWQKNREETRAADIA